MIHKLLARLGIAGQSDQGEFLRHAGRFVTADFFGRALNLVAIPIFTGIMHPSDFGIMATFIALVQMFEILFEGNLRVAVFRRYFEVDDRFPEFLGSVVMVLPAVITAFVLGGLLYSGQVSAMIGIERKVFLYAMLCACASTPNNVYLCVRRARKDSSYVAKIQVFRNTGILILTLGFAWLLPHERYMGRVWGQLIVVVALFAQTVRELVPECQFRFAKTHILYWLRIGVPMYPHSISAFVLSQFGQISVIQLAGLPMSGLYAFANQIGLVMSVVVTGMNNAWNPMFNSMTRDGQYDRIDRLARKYAWNIAFIAIIMILFAPVGMILVANRRYHEAVNLIPVIVTSYFFVFLYTQYVNIAAYHKQTFGIAVGTVLAGCVCVALNYTFIPVLGYPGAAYSLLISHAVLFFFNYSNVCWRLRIKERTPFKQYAYQLYAVVGCLAIHGMLVVSHAEIWLGIGIRILVLLLAGAWFILFHSESRRGRSECV